MKQRNISTNNPIYFQKIILGLFALAFIYVAVRSFILSFTIDESISFSIFNDQPVFAKTANNHLLNTYWMQFANAVISSSEWSLRLLNVIGFLFFSFASYQLLKLIENKWIQLFVGFLVIVNPYYIEFFSLARGYGISTGLLMMAIYYFLHPNYGNKVIYYSVLTAAFMGLALSANLGMVNFILAFVPLQILRWYFIQPEGKSFYTFFKQWKLLLLLLVYFGMTLLAMNRLLKLNEAGELYFGANSLKFTFNSIFQSWIYFPNSWVFISSLIKVLFPVILIPSMIIALLNFKKLNAGFYLASWILILILGMYLEHLIFDAKYPMLRTAMLFYPMIAFIIGFGLQELIAWKKTLRFALIPVASVIAFVISIQSFIHLNFSETYDWFFDKHTKNVAEIIHRDLIHRTTKESLGNNWLFEPTLNYYRNRNRMNVQPMTRNPYTWTELYIYDFSSSLRTVPSNYRILKEYRDIGTVLYLRTD